MHTQWYKHSINFIAALVVIMAGILITEPLAAAQTNKQDDVQATVVPGQLAPPAAEPGKSQVSRHNQLGPGTAFHQPGTDARLWF